MTVLGIVFIILKLNDVIDWSWGWVLSPIIVAVVFESIKDGCLQILKQAEIYKKGSK
jgi:hypothetical protein